MRWPVHPVGTLGAGTGPLRGPNPPPQPPAIVERRGETATKNDAGDASFEETRGETATDPRTPALALAPKSEKGM